MTNLVENDFYVLNECPWCGAKLIDSDVEKIYVDEFNCDIVRHKKCGIVFAIRRLNKTGLEKYWKNWSSEVHTSDAKKVEQRNKMYELDFKFIDKIISCADTQKSVLDVGCGEGGFLDIFKNNGYETAGVEFGEEAACIAGRSHTVYKGTFPDIFTGGGYNLIVFRGTLQYFDYPKRYLEKAMDILKTGGYIYITAQPNMNSFCFSLFGKKFILPVTGVDYIGYTEEILDKYFEDVGFRKSGVKFFYEDTPYADIENDILKVAQAIQKKNMKQKIDFISPAFYGNMMSLVYKKL